MRSFVSFFAQELSAMAQKDVESTHMQCDYALMNIERVSRPGVRN